mmetsp:Transcript_7979/g.20610  ORF Transcript_7979/g.20610 Transcript_7979/m.20610 type:complete len:230 (+) Transcript_7979:916-1605(+)
MRRQAFSFCCSWYSLRSRGVILAMKASGSSPSPPGLLAPASPSGPPASSPAAPALRNGGASASRGASASGCAALLAAASFASSSASSSCAVLTGGLAFMGLSTASALRRRMDSASGLRLMGSLRSFSISASSASLDSSWALRLSSSPQSVTRTRCEVVPPREPVASALRTTPIPSMTSPNTTCLPSSQGVASVQMKNCEPLVSGPALAMLRVPGTECFSVKFSSANFSP